MKRLNLFLMTIIFVAIPVLQSCNNNDGYSMGDIRRDWATVSLIDDNNYYLTSDNIGTLIPISSAVPWYKPEEGQRVVVYFNPLYDNYQGYDMAIKVEAIRNILTKPVEWLTAENDEEFGNDPVWIYKDGGMWVTGKYLNIVFRYDIPVNGNKHRVSLVEPETTIASVNDGYIHLEYRHNTYGDVSGRGYIWEGAVSFDIRTLNITPQTKGIKVKINSLENGETVVTLNLNSDEPADLKGVNYSTIPENDFK